MKKLILLISFLPLFASAQTVPNGNFENWYWAGWFEDPEFWVSDNSELLTTVSKDFDSYEGEFAMRVTAQPTGLGDYGEANTLFEMTAVPAALNFYVKTEVEFGGVSVEVTFLNQDTEVYTESWFGTSDMPEYTLISIPFDQIEPILTHARIKVIAQVGDLVAGTAWISVDAMEFGEPVGLDETKSSSFNIYPNPAMDIITIQSAVGSSLGNLRISDVLGNIVLEKKVQENQTTLDIQNFAAGLYMISSDQGKLKSSTFIVK